MPKGTADLPAICRSPLPIALCGLNSQIALNFPSGNPHPTHWLATFQPRWASPKAIFYLPVVHRFLLPIALGNLNCKIAQITPVGIANQTFGWRPSSLAWQVPRGLPRSLLCTHSFKYPVASFAPIEISKLSACTIARCVQIPYISCVRQSNRPSCQSTLIEFHVSASIVFSILSANLVGLLCALPWLLCNLACQAYSTTRQPCNQSNLIHIVNS